MPHPSTNIPRALHKMFSCSCGADIGCYSSHKRFAIVSMFVSNWTCGRAETACRKSIMPNKVKPVSGRAGFRYEEVNAGDRTFQAEVSNSSVLFRTGNGKLSLLKSPLGFAKAAFCWLFPLNALFAWKLCLLHLSLGNVIPVLLENWARIPM